MKATTKKLLLWLYQPDQTTNRQIDVSKLRLILPELKKSGFRSLLNLLKSQQLVVIEEGVVLTSYGRSSLEAQFPALKTLSRSSGIEWKVITFIEAPSSDKQFRYLRQFLLHNGCGQLTRGSYLYPGSLPVEIINTLHKLYVGKALVTGLDGWIFGDERLVVGRIFGLPDLKSGYSGISKEIQSLLRKINTQKSIEDKDKTAISLVFDRLIELLSVDLGLLQFYSPDVKSGSDLLAQLQSLIDD